ncbi:MAG TPA: exopolysaccharide biosynthesis protein [Xanthobacteraceae bacterium]
MRPLEPKKPPPGKAAHVPTSQVLRELIDEAPADHFTLDWLIASLPERSFGIIMLLLAVLAMVPIGSIVPGVLLAILAAQMTAGRPGPVFPRRIATYPLPTRHLMRMGSHAIQIMKYLERAVRPRWPTPFGATKRVIGIVVLLLASLVLLAPLPLTNVLPAADVALIALAFIEEDGVLLAIALFVALILLGLAAAAVWGAVVGAAAIGQL